MFKQKIAAPSVYHMLSCILSIYCFIISHFGFVDRISVLVGPVPGHCFLFGFSSCQ